MNFYKHYIGDFQRDTGHLSLTERGAYLALIHHYYATEKPLPKEHDALCRIAGAFTAPERKAVKVAMSFFEVVDSGLMHNRIEAELHKAGELSNTNRDIALAREAKRREEKAARTSNEPSTKRAQSVTRSLDESSTNAAPPQTPDSNKDSVPNGTDGDAVLTKQELWNSGKSILAEQGMPKPQCGTFVGKLVKDYGDEVVIDAVRSCVVKRPADAAQYLVATCKHLAGLRQKPDVSRQTVPSKPGIDPEILKAENDLKNRAPMPEYVRALVNKNKTGAIA